MDHVSLRQDVDAWRIIEAIEGVSVVGVKLRDSQTPLSSKRNRCLGPLVNDRVINNRVLSDVLIGLDIDALISN